MNHANYEALRARVKQAVLDSMPVSPDDGTVVVRFDEEGVPTWGRPSAPADEITTAVMAELFPAPVSVPVGEQIDDRVPAKWGCGCSTDQCRLRWDVFSDASTDPVQSMRVTCISHGLVGNSRAFKKADNQGMRQRAQALIELSGAHERLCE